MNKVKMVIKHLESQKKDCNKNIKSQKKALDTYKDAGIISSFRYSIGINREYKKQLILAIKHLNNL